MTLRDLVWRALPATEAEAVSSAGARDSLANQLDAGRLLNVQTTLYHIYRGGMAARRYDGRWLYWRTGDALPSERAERDSGGAA